MVPGDDSAAAGPCQASRPPTVRIDARRAVRCRGSPSLSSRMPTTSVPAGMHGARRLRSAANRDRRHGKGKNTRRDWRATRGAARCDRRSSLRRAAPGNLRRPARRPEHPQRHGRDDEDGGGKRQPWSAARDACGPGRRHLPRRRQGRSCALLDQPPDRLDAHPMLGRRQVAALEAIAIGGGELAGEVVLDQVVLGGPRFDRVPPAARSIPARGRRTPPRSPPPADSGARALFPKWLSCGVTHWLR